MSFFNWNNSVASKIKESDGFESVKKTLERNIVINLIDIEHFKDMSQEEIKEYTGDAISKKKALQNAVDEILRDQSTLRTLNNVKQEYGENDTTGDIIGPVQHKLREISQEQDTPSDAEGDGSGQEAEAAHGGQVGNAGPESDSEGSDQAGGGRQEDSGDTSGEDRGNARKRTATE